MDTRLLHLSMVVLVAVQVPTSTLAFAEIEPRSGQSVHESGGGDAALDAPIWSTGRTAFLPALLVARPAAREIRIPDSQPRLRAVVARTGIMRGQLRASIHAVLSGHFHFGAPVPLRL